MNIPPFAVSEYIYLKDYQDAGLLTNQKGRMG